MDRTMKFQMMIDLQSAIRSTQEFSLALDKLGQKKLSSNIGKQLQTDLESARAIVSQEVAKINSTLGTLGNVNLRNQQNQINSLTTSIGSLGRAMGDIKRHAANFAAMALIGGAIALPGLAIKNIADIEQQMAGMLQTLPSMYQKSADGMQTHTVNQAALNEVTKDFIGISAQYGFEVDKVIEAGKLWSRGYKEVGDVMKLTGNSTKLAIADMMDVALANRAVEATISGYKRQSDAVAFSSHIVDSWTNVAHNAQSSATDLAESMIRSAAAANVVGVSFDYVTAMASTMIKNTGQSGAIVGNSLKNIFSTLDSKKGRAALEDLGISIYKVSEDGTKHLRNMEHVIVDIMLAVSGTNKSLQKDFEGMSSKFQWGRAAAMFGDYAEFIKNYNLSIQSAGVADQQVKSQLDTINRKVEQIKANMSGVLMGAANAGLGRYIKDWLDSINMFLKGLQQIPTEAFAVVGTLAKFAVTIYTLSKFVGLLTTGFAALSVVSATSAVALEAEAIAANTAAAATGRLATAVTVSTGGLNLVLAAIIAAGVGATMYATSVGQAVDAIDKETQATQDSIATKESQLAMNAKQVEFIGTLGSAYTTLQSKLVEVQGDEIKTAEIQKNMEATHKELAIVVGQSAADRILASSDIKTAIADEQKVHAEKAEEIKSAMHRLVQKQIDLADTTINQCNERIGAINAEAIAFDKAADAIGEALGRIQKAMYIYYKDKVSTLGSMKEDIQKEADNGSLQQAWKQAGIPASNDSLGIAGKPEVTQFNVNLEGVTSSFNEQIDMANSKADEIKNNALSVLEAKKDTVLAGLYKAGTNAGNSRVGGDEVSSGGDPKKGHASTALANPPDNTQQLQRMELGREVNHLFALSKISADQYSTALEVLNTKEQMYGFSTENAQAKMKLMNKEILELIGQSMEYSEMGRDYETQAADKVASNEVLVASLEKLKVSWKDLTKDEKRDFLQSNKEYVQDMETLNRLLELSDKLKVASAEAGKKASNLGTDVAKATLENPRKAYQDKGQKDSLDESHELALLGYDSTESQKQVVQLKYAVKELVDAQAELNRVTLAYPADSLEIKKAQAEVDKLKNSVDKLANTKTDKLKGEFSDMVVQFATQGKSFNDIWKDIWKEFSVNAIKSLMGVKHSAGFLENILGGTGSNGWGILGFIGGLFGTRTPKKAHTGEDITMNAPKMHSGGEVTTAAPLKDDEVLRTLQVGERVLSKDQNSSFKEYIKQARGKSNGTQVTASVSQRTMDIASQVSNNAQALQISREHIDELQKSNRLMTMQVNIMQYMAEQGAGGNTIAQPIIMQQSMSDDALYAQISKMKSHGYNL